MLRLIFNKFEIDLNGCWNWQGCLNSSGYGRVKHFPEAKALGFVTAHRLSYYLFNGLFDSKALICHTCDNRKCINPNHLYEGTAKTNAIDRNSRGRNSSRKGTNNGRSKLTEEQVREIRAIGYHLTAKQIAEHYGVYYTRIDKIRQNLTWNCKG